jgi:hypothetical protein
MTAKILTETFGATSSDVEYRAILKVDTDKYRVSLRRNSHEFQSHARVEVLHASGWLPLIDLHPSEFAADLHAPIAGPQVTESARVEQARKVAKNLTAEAHRAFSA